MSQITRVAVVGSTGFLGQAVVQAILAKSSLFDLTILTRRVSADKVPAGVKTILVGSYEEGESDKELVEGLSGQEVLISTLNAAVAIRGKHKVHLLAPIVIK